MGGTKRTAIELRRRSQLLYQTAPELLEALKAMVNMEEWGQVKAGDGSTVGTAKAIIAKVEGRE